MIEKKSRISHDDLLDVYAKCDLCYFREQGPACVEKCPVNIEIKGNKIRSDVLCLDVAKPVNAQTFDKMRKQQTVSSDRKQFQA